MEIIGQLIGIENLGGNIMKKITTTTKALTLATFAALMYLRYGAMIIDRVIELVDCLP